MTFVDLPNPVAHRTIYLTVTSPTLPSRLHEIIYIISHAYIVFLFPVVNDLMYSWYKDICRRTHSSGTSVYTFM